MSQDYRYYTDPVGLGSFDSNGARAFAPSGRGMTVRVLKLTIQETCTYSDQYLRPYNTMLDNETAERIYRRFAMNANKIAVNPTEISDLTSTFLLPQPVPERQVTIANGWNNQRARFVLEVRIDYATGGASVCTLSGYTDFFGISTMYGKPSLAPDMVFYVNNITEARPANYVSNGINYPTLTAFNSSHVHCDSGQQNGYSIQQPGLQKIMRPMDVYNTMAVMPMYNDPVFQNGSMTDARNTIRPEAITSSRANSLPSSFASRIITAKLTSTANTNGNDQNNEAAVSMVPEINVFDNAFFKTISRVRDNGFDNNVFTMRDLIALDDNVDNVTNYIPISGGSVGVHQTGMTEGWGAADRKTMVATILSQSVPALMTRLGLTKVVFTSTNNIIGGQPYTAMQLTTVMGAGPEMSTVRHAELFKAAFEMEILPGITYCNQLSYTISMNVDLFGETWINLNLDNSGEYVFTTPSFSDGLFTPTITTNMDVLTQLSGDFNSLLDGIQHAIGATSHYEYDHGRINF